MEDNGKSRLIKQAIVFIVVFAAAFFATKYLAKAYLPKEKPAVEQGSPKK